VPPMWHAGPPGTTTASRSSHYCFAPPRARFFDAETKPLLHCIACPQPALPFLAKSVCCPLSSPLFFFFAPFLRTNTDPGEELPQASHLRQVRDGRARGEILRHAADDHQGKDAG
jgi:hypothetical protein